MSEDYFTGDMGSLWVQPDGPNTEPQYLGCHDLGDIAEPGGDITKRYCPDRAGHGRWKVALTSQGVPGDVTYSITTYAGKTADYLQSLANKAAKCPFPVYAHQSTCGRKDVFLAYEAGTLLQGSRITSRGKTNIAQREGADAAELTFELSADNPMTEYWPLRMSKLTTLEAQDLMDITLCGEDRCSGACGDERNVATSSWQRLRLRHWAMSCFRWMQAQPIPLLPVLLHGLSPRILPRSSAIRLGATLYGTSSAEGRGLATGR